MGGDWWLARKLAIERERDQHELLNTKAPCPKFNNKQQLGNTFLKSLIKNHDKQPELQQWICQLMDSFHIKFSSNLIKIDEQPEINYERSSFNIHLFRLFEWKLIFDDDLSLGHTIDHPIVADRQVHYGLINYVRDSVDYIISEITLQAGKLGLEIWKFWRKN